MQILKQVLSETSLLVEELESKILKLETVHDQKVIFEVFQLLQRMVGVGNFLGQKGFIKLPDLLLQMLSDLRCQRLQFDSEIIDLLLEALQKYQSDLGSIESRSSEITANENGTVSEELLFPATETILPQFTQFQNITDVPSQPSKQEKGTSPFEIEWLPGMKEDFVQEAREGVVSMERNLLSLEEDPNQHTLYHELFRTLHTLKGNAGVMLSIISDESIRQSHSLTPFKSLAHCLETVVGIYRDNDRSMGSEISDLLLKAVDELGSLIGEIDNDQSTANDVDTLISALDQHAGQKPRVQVAQTPSDSETTVIFVFYTTADQCLEMMNGALDQIANRDKISSALKKYSRGVKTLHKISKKSEYPAIFREAETLLHNLDDIKAGEATIEKTLPNFARLHLNLIRKEIEDLKRIEANRFVEKKPKTVNKIEKQAATPNASSFVRIPNNKVDQLMNLVGELMIIKNSFDPLQAELDQVHQLRQLAQKVKISGDQVKRISDELHANFMEIRMVPIGSIFSRFSRLVRDLSKQTGKQLQLKIKGEDVRLDRTVLEQISDPIMHLIRNSADHGIETPEERRVSGKPEKGTLSLVASQKGNHVMIEVSDDGRGLHRNKIMAKAIEMGLMTTAEMEDMVDADIYSMIFHPGFSTNSEVSEISGRGVGMDVVQTAIETIKGTVKIDSSQGKGTKIILTIPLSLALTRGLLVEAGNENFILPLELVQEMIKIDPARIRTFGKNHRCLEVRGKVVPVSRLSEAVDLKKVENNTAQSSLIIISDDQTTFALEVDKFKQEVEIMVKPLDGDLGRIPGVSGATIFSDGQVLLVLNPPELKV